MKIFSLVLLSFFLLSADHKPNLPNVVYILADDLGYADLGVYGQKLIETPNIDALAAKGMLFTQHYSAAPVCAPARAMLLTGLDAGHSPVRGNDEWKSRGDVWNLDSMYHNPYLEGQRPLPDSIFTLAKLFKNKGYKTGMVGKWGLGAPLTNSIPNKMGFDFFYGYNCQRVAHTYYPPFLWKNEERVNLNNKVVALHANLAEGADPSKEISYEDFTLNDYAPKLLHEEALKFISDNKSNPFFLYYASPIPHVPLQAPQKWFDYYRKKFGPEKPFTGKSYYPTIAPHAAYAAMISYLDEQVGELVAKLKEEGVYDNTLIIFTSDNGPTFDTGGYDPEYFNSAKPFHNGYGRTKGFVYEGGVRVPMIAVWPGKIKEGSKSDHISIFYDVLPTMAEIINEKLSSWSDGISFLSSLLGKDYTPEHEYLYWEFVEYGGMQAVRKGNWKAIRKNIKKGNMKVELYNLDNDITEDRDLSDKYPEIVKKMEEIMEKEHNQAGMEAFRMKELGDKMVSQ